MSSVKTGIRATNYLFFQVYLCVEPWRHDAGMPKGRADHLKEKQFKVSGDRPLAKTPITVRLPQDVDDYIRSLPDKTKWLQKVLSDAAAAENINNNIA